MSNSTIDSIDQLTEQMSSLDSRDLSQIDDSADADADSLPEKFYPSMDETLARSCQEALENRKSEQCYSSVGNLDTSKNCGDVHKY